VDPRLIDPQLAGYKAELVKARLCGTLVQTSMSFGVADATFFCCFGSETPDRQNGQIITRPPMVSISICSLSLARGRYAGSVTAWSGIVLNQRCEAGRDFRHSYILTVLPWRCCWCRSAMSNPRAACGPVEGFVRPSLAFRCIKNILHTENLSLFWLSWIRHFWCRWSSVPLYHICYHCS